MSRATLERALARRRRHLSPFFVLGDPSPSLTVELAANAVCAGATMVELGLPFSDPCADGPAIVAASRRALAAGVSTRRALELLREVAGALPGVAQNLLVYANLVHARGLARFCDEAAAAGASSLLVPDLPFGEDAPLAAACRASGLGHVRLAGPATPPSRLAALAEGTSFVYVAGHQGVTGAADDAAARAATLARARAACTQPLALGFGLASAADVAAAFAAGASIAVVGSHLARAIERGAAASARERDAAVLRAVHDAFAPLAAPLAGDPDEVPAPCS